MKVRADKEEEISGLDITEHGERGYNYAITAGSPFGESLNTPVVSPSTISDIGVSSHQL